MKTLLKVTLTITALALTAGILLLAIANIAFKLDGCKRHDFTPIAHRNMDIQLRAAGLAPTPAHTHYYGGISIVPPYTDGSFKIQTKDANAWLKNSPSLYGCRTITKPNKTAYLFHVPNKNRIGILVISNDRETGWYQMSVDRIDLIKKAAKPEDQWHTTQNAEKNLNEMPDNNTAWIIDD